ncbi:MAG TPA: type IV pilin N-terminal domain-containing protein, partial [Candidatus Thermoplasmatota archaeon]
MRLRAFQPPAVGGRAGVSEVVGSVLLLLITVAAFAVLFLMVQGVPKPAPGVSSDFEATMDFIAPTTAVVELRHLGGTSLTDDTAALILAVDNTTVTYGVSDGLVGPGDTLNVGSTWRVTIPMAVANDTRVTVSVVSYVSNELLFQAVLQAGDQGGPGGHAPIITVAWAVSSAGTPRVYNNGLQTYRVHAVVVDVDGDLDAASPPSAQLTVVPAGSSLATTAIGSGAFAMVGTGGSHFQTPDLVMSPGVVPAAYSVVVVAQDEEGLTAQASLPLEVVSSSTEGGPTLNITSVSTAPVSVSIQQQNVSVLKLSVSSAGEATSLAQVVVGKGGSLPDGDVTAALWLDGDSNGAFSEAGDVRLTPPAAFAAGFASIFAAPITTVPAGGTLALFVVVSFDDALDGTNASFWVSAPGDVRGTGVTSGAAATASGPFPLESDTVVIGSRLEVALAAGIPDRILEDSTNVRAIGLLVRAAGEPITLTEMNVTLAGNIDRSSVKVHVRIDGQHASQTRSFNGARIAQVPLAWTIETAADWVPLEVYVNLTKGKDKTIGLDLAASIDLHGFGMETGEGRNSVSAQPFPISSGLVTVTDRGNLSADLQFDGALSTAMRAGLSNVYLMTVKLRAHGELIDFNKFEVSKSGTLTDAQFSAMTLRVRGGPWFSATFFSGKVTWDAGVTGKLFAIPINVTNTGEAVVDLYANLTTGTQGKNATFTVLDTTKLRGYGKVSLQTLTANAEAEPYPFTSGDRRVMGDVHVFGTQVAPAFVLAPKALVPILKLTLRPIGENLTLNELFVGSLQGVPPAGSVTLRLFRDVGNNTTTALGGDDVELAPGQAGGFDADAFKAFVPSLSVPVAVDTNLVVVMDFTAQAAGWSAETRVNTTLATFTGAYSGASVPPNSVIGGP